MIFDFYLFVIHWLKKTNVNYAYITILLSICIVLPSHQAQRKDTKLRGKFFLWTWSEHSVDQLSNLPPILAWGGGEIAQLIPFCANCTANDYACFKLISFPKPTKTAAVFSEFYFQSSIFMGSDIIFFIYVNFLCVLFDVIGSFCSTCIRINYFLFFFLPKVRWVKKSSWNTLVRYSVSKQLQNLFVSRELIYRFNKFVQEAFCVHRWTNACTKLHC